MAGRLDGRPISLSLAGHEYFYRGLLLVGTLPAQVHIWNQFNFIDSVDGPPTPSNCNVRLKLYLYIPDLSHIMR